MTGGRTVLITGGSRGGGRPGRLPVPESGGGCGGGRGCDGRAGCAGRRIRPDLRARGVRAGAGGAG